MTLILVQGDTAPDLNSTITRESDGMPLNLASCTVRFQMRKPDDRRFTVNASAAIVSESLGQVRYSWAANDLTTPGDYQIQWEVTYPGGNRVQTTASPEMVTIRRQ